VCIPKVWGSISATLIAAAAILGGGVASWATGGGMSALMLAIPGIVCPMSMIYEMLPKEGLPGLENIKEFADDKYFQGGYKADTEKTPIRMLVSGAKGRVKQGYGLEGKKLVKPDEASADQKNNYARYLLGLKAQQKQDEAIEGIKARLEGLAKKKSEEEPEADAVAVQQEHMIYERWQLIAGINKRVL